MIIVSGKDSHDKDGNGIFFRNDTRERSIFYALSSLMYLLIVPEQ